MILQSKECEEVTRYKKKALKACPKKAKHKHDYQPCIFEYVDTEFSKERGFVPGAISYKFGAYCSICGKIGKSSDDWYQWVPTKPNSHFGRYVPTELAKRELDAVTRTLPTYCLEDVWYQKYVTL